jgi:hypothetical protein
MKHLGDLIITKENCKTFKKLTEVSGSVYVQEGATFTAPALTKSGSVYVQEGATFTAPALTEVSGSVYVRQGATFTAPALTEVSGSVYVRQGATFTAPALTKSGSVDVRQGATFTAPALTEVSGYVDVRQGATFTAPALTKSGSVDVQEGATFTAPALTEVSGYVDVRQGAIFTAPALTKSGSVYVRQGATFTAPALTKSGYVYVQEGATFTAPALTEVSGYVDVQEGATFTAPALTINNNIAVIDKKKYDVVRFDCVMFLVENTKTTKGIKIYSGFYQLKISDNKVLWSHGFIAQKDNFTAHGETVKKSIDDLNFKLVSEKLKNEPINADTIITINYYRLITGACELGVKDWMQRNNMVEESYRADELIPILEKTNAYGLERFKKLVNFKS